MNPTEADFSICLGGGGEVVVLVDWLVMGLFVYFVWWFVFFKKFSFSWRKGWVNSIVHMQEN